MMTTRFASLLALPVLSAGIIGGAALGLAGTAHADIGAVNAVRITDNGSTVTVSRDDDPTASVSDDDDYDSTDGGSFNAAPNVLASPAPNFIPWAQWINEGNNSQDMYGAVVGTIANP